MEEPVKSGLMKAYKFSILLFLIIISVVSVQSGMVAYSTELEERSLYTYSLSTFKEIWKSMFFWAFLTIFCVHVLASAIALATLRKHKYGRYFGIVILVYGCISGLVVSCLSSAAIAFVLYQAKVELYGVHTMLAGFCQSGLLLLTSFLTLRPTL